MYILLLVESTLHLESPTTFLGNKRVDDNEVEEISKHLQILETQS